MGGPLQGPGTAAQGGASAQKGLVHLRPKEGQGAAGSVVRRWGEAWKAAVISKPACTGTRGPSPAGIAGFLEQSKEVGGLLCHRHLLSFKG